MAGIFERGGLTEDLRYPSALMRMMRGTDWAQCYQGSQPIDLSRIPVNKGTNLRLGWTKYSDLYEIVHPSLVLISLCFLIGGKQERSIAAIFWKNCSPVIKHNPFQLACLTSALMSQARQTRHLCRLLPMKAMSS